MARGPNKLPAPEKVGPELGALTAEAATAEGALNAADRMVLDQTEVLIRTGRIQTADMNQKLNRVCAAKEFIQIRDSKKYKGLSYLDADGKHKHVCDLEEYCQFFLGRTYESVRQDAANLNMLGEELYAHALALGLTSRDFRDYRALPQTDQQLVKEALESKTREAVIEILQSAIARHAADKDKLQKTVKNLEADLEAARNVSAARNQKIDELETQLHRRAALPEQEREAEFIEGLNGAAMKVGAAMIELEKAIKDIVDREGVPNASAEACQYALCITVERCWDIANRHLAAYGFNVHELLQKIPASPTERTAS